MGWFNKIMVADTNTGIIQDITDLDKEHYESFLEVTERLRIAYNVLVGREGKESSDETPAGNCIKPAVIKSVRQCSNCRHLETNKYCEICNSNLDMWEESTVL